MVILKWRRRIWWGGIISLLVLVLAIGVIWRAWSLRHMTQWKMLRHVSRIEAVGADEETVQMLGSHLAILGRDNEVRQLDFLPQFDLPPLEVDTSKLDLKVVPWSDGFRQIASDHRIVMIMENHFVSKHREMIGATLQVFRDAGFTHYAAEALGESGNSLTSRGYPVVNTGYYTADPRFGNLLRKALDLKFKVVGYDFSLFKGHEVREEFAAGQLARLFEGDTRSKLVVHAGFNHVYKHETELGTRWLASMLWEKTGIEPFTIWQWSDMHDAHEYRVVADAIAKLGDFDEPVLLIPPPNKSIGLRDIPRVDAILVHPPDQSVAPGERSVLFPNKYQRVSGEWVTEQWPVIVAAYKKGEPVTAIPLDQIMLRDREKNFILWIPASMALDLVVFDQNGILDTGTSGDHNSLRVRVK